MNKLNDNKKLFFQILFIFLVSRAVYVVIYLCVKSIMGMDGSFEEMFGRWDADRYIRITEYGYELPTIPNDPQNNWAFFPLYPLICMGLRFITFGVIPTFYIGMIVSNVCIFAATFISVKTVRLMGLTKNERDFYTSPNSNNNKVISFLNNIYKDGLLMAWMLLLGPYTMYMGTMYTESTYILFIVLAFYLMKKRRFLPAGLIIACAGATRNMGVLLVIPLLIEMYIDWIHTTGRKNIFRFIGHIFTTPVKLLAVIVTPIGTFLYMLFLYLFCGDALAFMHVQIAWRGEEHYPIIGVLWDAITLKSSLGYMVIGWICIAAIVVYVYMLIKRLFSEAVFGGLTLAVPLTSSVMSTPRFITGDYVIWIGIYDFVARRTYTTRVIMCTVFLVASIITTSLWIGGYVKMI